MATKAEQFRAASQRSGKARRKLIDTTMGGPADRATGVSRKAAFALETTLPSQPASRKATRRSANRQKAAIALKAKQLLAVVAPTHRHEERPSRGVPRA